MGSSGFEAGRKTENLRFFFANTEPVARGRMPHASAAPRGLQSGAMHPAHPALRSAVALVFVASIGAVYWLDRRPTSTVPHAELGFAFTEVAARAGIQFQHEKVALDPKLANVEPHVAGMGAAVAVADFDSDGWPDLYATTSRFGARNALFQNRRDGTFEDVAAAAGVADVNRPEFGSSMGSLFADIDNDGDPDLLIYKWGYPQLFRNEGDRTFRDITESAGLKRWLNSNGAVFFDYDRDGLLDLYLAGYFRDDLVLWDLKTTRIMQESFEFANNGGHNYLFRNVGGGRFEDVTARAGVDSTRWTLACASADFDDNGWADLYLANDYSSEELFLNQGDGTFRREDEAGLDVGGSKSGMSVALGDFTNEGRVGVYVTNISRSGYLFQGNNLRVNRLGEAGTLDDIAEGQVADCGWSWGAQFADFDNDGWTDLFVANGFISNDPKRDYWYGMSKVAGGLGSLAEDAATWDPIGDRSLSGFERSRVLKNRAGQGFQDVAEQAGVTDLYDGRAVACADLWNRGTVDVVVANQLGPLLVYRNEVAAGRGFVSVELVGSKSNRGAVGASVTVRHSGRPQMQVVTAGTGFCSQNDWRLHFGLGAARAADAVEIRWPSGATETLRDVAAGSWLRIEESSP